VLAVAVVPVPPCATEIGVDNPVSAVISLLEPFCATLVRLAAGITPAPEAILASPVNLEPSIAANLVVAIAAPASMSALTIPVIPPSLTNECNLALVTDSVAPNVYPADRVAMLHLFFH